MMIKPKKYKSIKTFINISNPYYIEIYTKPKYELYIQKEYFFGLIKTWKHIATLTSNPKKIFNVVESNY